MLSIILIILASSFSITHAASMCYACNPCGTTWDSSVASVISTSSTNDYCRKRVTGTLVIKDSVSTCTSVNILDNGVYCCQTDICNTANKQSIKIIRSGFIPIFLWAIYSYMY